MEWAAARVGETPAAMQFLLSDWLHECTGNIGNTIHRLHILQDTKTHTARPIALIANIRSKICWSLPLFGRNTDTITPALVPQH
jgi:hypothetical protein